jgi:hypothetical protein
MEKYLTKGKKGHYGEYRNDLNKNDIVDEINKLVSYYNSKINSFDTELENNIFHDNICDEIKKLEKKL